eukprot:6193747-Pleurochrysis_carterae.AAC.2
MRYGIHQPATVPGKFMLFVPHVNMTSTPAPLIDEVSHAASHNRQLARLVPQNPSFDVLRQLTALPPSFRRHISTGMQLHRQSKWQASSIL